MRALSFVFSVFSSVVFRVRSLVFSVGVRGYVICMLVCLCVCLLACVFACVFVCLRVRACVRACMLVCLLACVCVCVFVSQLCGCFSDAVAFV